MKTRSTITSLLFAAAAFTFLNCTGKSESHDNNEGNEAKTEVSEKSSNEQTNAPQFQVDKKFQEQLASVFTSYVELKDALVASDAAKVKAGASQTLDALSKVDMKLLTGAAHNDWMTYLTPMETTLKEISNASDIEVQRRSFSTLTDNMYKSVKAFGLNGKQAFYEYCPMAFNNEGAYWLSDNNQIRNPYFGDKMLTCGEVKETLQ